MYSLLIADDEEIERRAFRMMINKNFPSIIVLEDAVNGIDLVDKLVTEKPDITIVDINMPGLNGLEAVKEMRARGLSSKIIIRTAYSKFEYAQEALSLGAEEYILKSVKREKILAAISNCIFKIDKEKKVEEEYNRLKKLASESVGNYIYETEEEQNTKINNFVNESIQYIKEHFKEDISLKKVAEEIHISSYYLSRLFKQELKKNFIDYITEIRMKQALKLLKEKEYLIKELSESVGYSNPTYFCKVFKSYTGKTIGEYKNNSIIK